MNRLKTGLILGIITFVYHSVICAEDGSLNSQERALVNHVKASIERAEKGISKLDQGVLQIEGMSSAKVRHLLNNICSMEDTRYLEVGCWKGSTWVAALYGNQDRVSKAVAVDDWSQFGGPYHQFTSNSMTFLPPSSQYSVYSKDCFSLSLNTVFKKPVNVYFYDGDHSAIAHEKAFTYYNDVLDTLFIAIVDDWNYGPVPQGTRAAFAWLGYKVLYEKELPAAYVGDTAQWWNGLYVAVVRKSLPKINNN